MRPAASLSYRPEIDGLRAVAVLAVIFSHAGFTVFGGGFVGVDVFFVISGYLITAIIVSELEKGSFSLVRFYERRARRILPALFLVMACCIPFALFWMEPEQYKSFVKSLAAMVLFGSNFFFWWKTDYFAPEGDEIPLLHTWSLSVEEQFYLLFPLLLLVLWRFGRSRPLLVMAALAGASLLLSEFAWRYAPAANFYLAPTRAWELLAGAICTFTLNGRQSIKLGGVSNFLSLAGLGMIVAAIFLFNEETPMPSLFGLIPVIGTCFVILFAAPSTWTARILATPLLVGIGLISYSAYLWHQPLFAFALIRLPYDLNVGVMLLLSALSFCLAYLSWRFVERPFRLGHAAPLLTRKQIFALSAVAGCLLVSVVFTNNKKPYLSGMSKKAAHYANFHKYAKDPKRQKDWGGNCFVIDAAETIPPECLRIDPGKKNYILIGDSHAAHLNRALREAFPNDNILQATVSSCRPFVVQTGTVRCDKFYEKVFKDFLPHHAIDGVILCGRWEKSVANKLDKTLEWVSKHSKRVIVVGPVMIYTRKLPSILSDYDRFGESTLEGLASRRVDSMRYEINDIVRTSTRKHGAEFVDILSVQCPHKRCRAVTAKDEPLAFDRAHLTLPGSRLLVNALVESGDLQL